MVKDLSDEVKDLRGAQRRSVKEPESPMSSDFSVIPELKDK